MSLTETVTGIQAILLSKDPPTAVKLFKPSQNIPTDIRLVDRKSRYCPFLMRARHGETLLLTTEKLAYPEAYVAFVFGPLLGKISSGQMLHVLGLYQTKDAATITIAKMPRLKRNSVSAITAEPLKDFPLEPDIAIVEGSPEQIMWLCLARIFETGRRLNSSSSIFQCYCVGVTVVLYITKEVNISPCCYGTCEATDVPPEHMFMGIPMPFLSKIENRLKTLSKKAMIRARGKGVYHAYCQQECKKRQG
ncbi:MAG: DUF169 domain-containing protein [Candidatus Bathyarchaeota archaeon]|nr:DUF169 domain-containing protein [Candidatus Bathyarchaeota archaeon]MDH5494688.1 DUF169 domain-containing protein [Candidatus Bathyarchaeota archaeon]